MIKIGVIGYGYWGPNLVRNFMEVSDAQVVAVSDLSTKNTDLVARRYPGVKTCNNAKDLIDDPHIDALVIATPVRTHFELADAALKAGKHVLIEKPMTETPDQSRRLIEEAERRNLTLMVDHTFIYTGAVRKIRELIVGGDLGDIYYHDSTRINLGLFQHDVDVIWDLAVHDLSILNFLIDETPSAVSATGTSHVPNSTENVAYISLFFDSGTIAHINVNWLSPVKIRRTVIGGSKKMIVYDDLEPSEKIKIYDKGITVTDNPEEVYKMLVGYRTGDMWAPKLNSTEALSEVASHFIDCIEHSKQPITNGRESLRTVVMAAAATASMKKNGHPVKLGQD